MKINDQELLGAVRGYAVMVDQTAEMATALAVSLAILIACGSWVLALAFIPALMRVGSAVVATAAMLWALREAGLLGKGGKAGRR